MNNIILTLIFTSFSSYIFAQDEVLAFVGEYVNVEERFYTDEYLDNCNCIIMDSIFEAKYKVKKVLFGNYDNDEITFTVFDHYGFPSFAKQKTAIIYLTKHQNGYFHLKYEWNSVTPLKNGGYAACEDNTLIDDKFKVEIKDFEFEPPIKIDLSHSTEYLINQYKEDPLFKIVGDEAVCIKGISAEDIFKYNWPDVIEDQKLEVKN